MLGKVRDTLAAFRASPLLLHGPIGGGTGDRFAVYLAGVTFPGSTLDWDTGFWFPINSLETHCTAEGQVVLAERSAVEVKRPGNYADERVVLLL